METDKDHIHYLIETEPTISISKIVNLMKSYTTYHIWQLHQKYLSRHFWKEHTFWTDGYFVCSIGNVSEKMLKEYIENQGWCSTISSILQFSRLQISSKTFIEIYSFFEILAKVAILIPSCSRSCVLVIFLSMSNFNNGL